VGAREGVAAARERVAVEPRPAEEAEELAAAAVPAQEVARPRVAASAQSRPAR
jgi:hypothetical protein